MDAMDRANAQSTLPDAVAFPLAPAPSDAPSATGRMRILLADDNRTNREVALGHSPIELEPVLGFLTIRGGRRVNIAAGRSPFTVHRSPFTGVVRT